MMQALNLTAFPLDSLALIEASAGTGKTYALANLYLRYLLERQLSVEQILVVTFTEAATQELKDRIRLRIQDLRKVFEGAGTDDPVLSYLYSQSAEPEKDQLRLRLAERQIDQAQIHTIHGFCQQVIKGHALDANLPLQQTLLEDQTQIRKTALEDFWRRYLLTLDEAVIHFVVAHWPNPQALLSALSPLLNREPEAIIPLTGKDGLEEWLAAFQRYHQWYLELKHHTLEMLEEVRTLLSEQPLKRNNDKLKWLAQIRTWAESEDQLYRLPKIKEGIVFIRFTQSRVNEDAPARKSAPEHAYFRFLENHLQVVLPEIKPLFLASVYPLVKSLIDEAKQEQNGFSFDDLIKRVASALQLDKGTLATTIAEPYEAALIDEFQDTDPDQYFIFDTLFGTRSTKALPRLVLIGDPKQAIYGFRGGDIQTYLQAKRNVSQHARGQVFTMDTNWRSSPAMVEAVNTLFGWADDAFMAKDIPFQKVRAARKMLPGLPSQALVISQLMLPEKASKAEIESVLAEHCVQQIQSLIGQSANLLLEQERPLQHSDIAILVRSAREGELIKQRLSGVGLTATLDSQSSIYHSLEARALYFLLAAAADPKDEQALRRCLAEPFFGLDDIAIAAFNEQAGVFSYHMQQFEYLHQKWQQSGILSMIREALKVLGVFDYWHQQQVTASQPDHSRTNFNADRNWERSLTNWNQLAEILQKQSRTQKGHFALLRWYQDTLSAALSGSAASHDEAKLRLESDAELIRIVTIHKSKGLEYPFVFIPFLFSSRGASEAWFYNDQGALTLDLTCAEESMLAAGKERLAEDMRLLYVALTRAKYQCYLGTAAYKGLAGSLGFGDTALACLLFNGEHQQKPDEEMVCRQLINLQAALPDGIAYQQITVPSDEQVGPPPGHDAVLPAGQRQSGASDLIRFSARELSRSIQDGWRVQSFTGLMHEHQLLARSQHSPRLIQASADNIAAVSRRQALNILQFPKGAQAGTFLHTLFEHLDFRQAELQARLRSTYPDLKSFIETRLKLARLVEEHMLIPWADYLTQWVAKVLATPLLQDIRLADLTEDHYIVEMEFYFAVRQMESAGFNALLTSWVKNAHHLEFSSFEGHLKGAIDLVFEAQGKFYILDYKSNYLGDTADDYLTDNLQVAMEEHRYDVQYLIYSLALHRFLKQRLKARYDYARDFGGVIYLFLRGLNLEQENGADPQAGSAISPSGQASPGVYFVRPPMDLIAALDQEIGS